MRHGNEENCATRITFLRSIWFRTVQSLAWMLSGTIPHPRLGSIGSRPLPGAEISAVRQGWDCEAGELCQRDIAPKWSSPGARVIPLLLAPGWHFLRSFCVCRALGWLRAESMPGLVQLMGKTWWLPVTQNILIISSGFFSETHFWMTVLIFIYIFLSIPNIPLTSCWEIETQPAFIYLFVFYFASCAYCGLCYLCCTLCANNFWNPAVKLPKLRNRKTPLQKSAKNRWEKPPIVQCPWTSTNATFARWLGMFLGERNVIHGPS